MTHHQRIRKARRIAGLLARLAMKGITFMAALAILLCASIDEAPPEIAKPIFVIVSASIAWIATYAFLTSNWEDIREHAREARKEHEKKSRARALHCRLKGIAKSDA